MDQSIYNLCFFLSNKLFSIIGLQTDDILFLANKAFVEAE